MESDNDPDAEGFDETPCKIIDVSVTLWSRIHAFFQSCFLNLTVILPEIYPYLIILCISVISSVTWSYFMRPGIPPKPVGVVRIGFFKKCPEFRHIFPHKNLTSKLSDDNVLKFMASDPDISSVRISLIANGTQ